MSLAPTVSFALVLAAAFSQACAARETANQDAGKARARDAAVAGDADALPGDGGSHSLCGNTARRLVDFLPELPDSGRAGVSPPPLRSNGTDLFYELSWYAPAPLGKGGAIMRIGARGAPVRLAAVTGGGSDSGQGLALTRAAVVFSQNGPGDGGAGAIMSVPFAGGEVATLAQSSGQVSAIVVDDANVYFVDDAGTERVSQAGGAVVTLSTVKPFSLAVVGGSLYLAAPSSHEVYAVPVGGGPTTVLAEDADGPERIIPCGEHLCWTAGPLMSANLKQWVSGGAAVLADGLYKPFEVAFTGRSFFLTAGGSELYRIPATGGAGISIADGAGLTAVAVDHDCLYWSSLRGIYSWDLDAAESTPGISAEQ